MVGGVGLTAESIAPRLAVLPVLPPGRVQQLAVDIVELGRSVGVGPYPFGHADQRRAHRLGKRSALVDRLEELDLGAVEVCDDRTFGPTTRHRIVLRRQMMKVKDISVISPSGPKRCLPD